MTLSGNLGFVPLDEVLRLLTRAGNDGMVRITNSGTSGRIYVVGDGIGLATTMVEPELQSHLIRSGYISEADAEGVEKGSKSFSDLEQADQLTALIREITIESIHQMNVEDAEFRVVKDEVSPFTVPEVFDLESVLADSKERASRWEKVRKSIPNLEAKMHLNRDLEAETVEVDKETWRILSELGAGASVSDLAVSLGTTEFDVGRVASKMVDRDLIFISAPVEPVESGYSAPETSYVDEEDTDDEVAAETVAVATTEDADAHQRSWWEEPEAADESDDTSDEDVDVVVDADSEDETDESSKVEEYVTGFDAADDDSESDDDEDTEAFLEKVFSELEPAAEDADTGGHGLTKRRRIGSILRELDED
jgi:hypothetical protein